MIWTALFRQAAHDRVCVPFDVAADDAHRFLGAMSRVGNLDGMIVTIPHKPAASVIADSLTARAAATGAANVLRPTAGDGCTAMHSTSLAW